MTIKMKPVVACLALVVLTTALGSRATANMGELPGPFIRSSPEKPAYPSDWRVRGFDGRAEVDIWVSETGGVDSARAVGTGYGDTDSAVVRFAQGCSFEPYRDLRGNRAAAKARLWVSFATPRSANLIRERDRAEHRRGSTTDSTGRVYKLDAELACSVVLDSVSGAFVYNYSLQNAATSQAKLVYFAVLPVDPTTNGVMGRAGVRVGGVDLWPGMGGCGDQSDVLVWMSNATYEKRGRPAAGIEPGEGLGPFQLVSFDPPVPGRWLTGGAGGCGAACYPWAARCDLAESIKGRTFVPGSGGQARGALRGEVDCVAPGPPLKARVAVLGARREIMSDTNGLFRLDGVPTGAFRVRVTAPGYERWESWVDIVPGEQNLTVKLVPEKRGLH